MALTAQQIIDRAQRVLVDETSIRWPVSELLDWVNAGQVEIVRIAPDAYTHSEVTQLVAGTRQSAPAAAMRLIDVMRNMGSDGTTPGRAIRPVDRTVLDVQQPDWHSSTPNAQVLHYTFDMRDPKNFYVYPPQPDPAGYVELVYAGTPPLLELNDPVAIDAVYENALLDYVLYRAFSKDAEYAADGNRAVLHWQAFSDAITTKEAVDRGVEPNPQNRPQQ